jgi:TRAP-type C4-dicarboxylate transport system substrate-binding protein
MNMRMKIGGYQGDGSVHTRGLREFVARLGPEAGRPDIDLTIDVTADGIAANELFAGVEEGRYDLCYMASGYLSARVPVLELLDVPFSVSDRGKALSRLDGAVGEVLRQQVKDVTGLQVLGFWDNGFRHVSNRLRPIRRPEDCADLVIRTLNNQTYVELLKDLGFKPVITDVKELVAKVRCGEVDAQENPLTNLVNFGLHEFHRHVSITSHIFGVVLFVANGDWWDGLDETGRDAIRQAAHAATEVQRRASVEDDEEMISVLEREGVQILHPDDIDMAAFREAGSRAGADIRRRQPRELCDAYLQG